MGKRFSIEWKWCLFVVRSWNIFYVANFHRPKATNSIYTTHNGAFYVHMFSTTTHWKCIALFIADIQHFQHQQRTCGKMWEKIFLESFFSASKAFQHFLRETTESHAKFREEISWAKNSCRENSEHIHDDFLRVSFHCFWRCEIHKKNIFPPLLTFSLIRVRERIRLEKSTFSSRGFEQNICADWRLDKTTPSESQKITRKILIFRVFFFGVFRSSPVIIFSFS